MKNKITLDFSGISYLTIYRIANIMACAEREDAVIEDCVIDSMDYLEGAFDSELDAQCQDAGEVIWN